MEKSSKWIVKGLEYAKMTTIKSAKSYVILAEKGVMWIANT